ncbi:chemotaxis protein CheA [Aminivibrio sp.]
MTTLDMSQYLGPFLDEAGDNLKHLDDLILVIEKDPANGEAIAEIFRSAHTLKGMSATMGFEKMATLTHSMEDMLDAVRRGKYTLGPKDIDLLFRSLDTLQIMVDSIREGESDSSVDIGDLAVLLRSAASRESTPLPADGATPPAKTALSEEEQGWIREAAEMGLIVHEVADTLTTECMLKAARAFMVVNRLEEMGEIIRTSPRVEAIENEEFGLEFTLWIASSRQGREIQEAAARISEVASVEVTEPGADCHPAGEKSGGKSPDEPSPEETPGKKKNAPPPGDPHPDQRRSRGENAKKLHQTVRVETDRLDKLMNLVGELVIGRARIERLVQEARLRDFDEPLSQLGRISGDIQELVTKLRMVPVSFIFDRFPRLVRDLERTLGKEIDLVLEGQETELDRTVIDEIGDPMVHIVRNCMDHGIEMPGDRRRAGKDEKGRIRIAAYQEGSGVIIEVTDDGKGIDAAKVREKALAKGVISEEESLTMSDEDMVNLIFLPGFSLAEKVTDVSGRGVGMDAVKSKVESLGGQFEVSTEVGKGTSVFLRLPLTLAIVLALLVKVGGETYALPLENVEETILVRKENMKTVHGTPAVLLRGDVLTLCDLGGLLGAVREEGKDRREYPVVVVRTGRTRVGFVVDELIGQQDIVIKSLGRFLSKIKGIGGATILGDGNVALILDTAGLYAK